MSTLNPNNPIFQLLVAALIGILVGSAGVTALAYNNGLPGLVAQTGETSEKLDTLDNRTQDIAKTIEEIKNEVNRIEKKLDENTINVDGEYIKYLKEVLSAINNEVQMIEKKLDANGIDVNGTFASQVLNQLKNISATLSNLNVTVINNNITNITNQVNNVYNLVSQINNYVQNIYNFTENNYLILNEISITLNEIYILIYNEIYQQIYMVNITVNQINFYVQDIYQIVIYISSTVDMIYNILVDIQVSIQQIIDTLIIINFKTQKEVIIDIEHISDSPDPLVKQLYVMVSLEGEGGLNTTAVSIYVLNVPDAAILIEETGIPGLYNVIVLMPENTPPGSYLLVVEGEIVLPLPDGSQEVFRGRKMISIYIW